MNREEAIEALTRIKWVYVGNELFEAEKEQAIEIAIEALEREPSEDGTLEVKVEDATKVGRVLISDDKHRGGLYYPDEDEPKGDDLISRAEAIDAIENINWYHQNQNKDMVSGANSDEHQVWYKAQDIYKALEAVPQSVSFENDTKIKSCSKDSDLISRADAIEAMGEEPPVWCDEEYEIAERNQWRDDVEAIKSVPSADRPRGEWKQIEINGYPYAVCDQCHLLADIVEKDGELVMSMANADEKCANFCPNCGADMRGETK